MKYIIPITELRNTVKLDKFVNKVNEPVFITKNGYSDLVIMSQDYYLKHLKENNAISNNDEVKKINLISKTNDEVFGYVRVKTTSIDISISNVTHNKNEIIKEIKKASEEKVQVLVFQELTLVGVSIGDIIFNNSLIKEVNNSLKDIAKATIGINMLVIVGAPIEKDGGLYNTAIHFFNGEIIAVVPKKNITRDNSRYFLEAPETNSTIIINNKEVLFGNKIIFVSNYYNDLKIATEINDDINLISAPSISYAEMGATLICNLGATPELVGSKDFKESLVKVNSTKLSSAYAMSNATYSESSGEVVYSGHQLIAETGHILDICKAFDDKASSIADIDIEKIVKVRTRSKDYRRKYHPGFAYIGIDLLIKNPDELKRQYWKNPFIPDSKEMDLERVNFILEIQAHGLIKRLKTIRQEKVILGLSGGLDSTLALLVCVYAFDKLKLPRKNIIAITMPAFGTTQRTKNNAYLLAESLNTTIKEIDLSNSVRQHLIDIGHDLEVKNIAYENAQARTRTMVLMNLANEENALQIGTGDLSELCLGWCTYNGDHMSMYSVNGSVPKTLVSYVCKGFAMLFPNASSVLNDIISTPISPELISNDESSQIVQKTEDIIGPYFFHDFILYHYLKYGYSIDKLFYLASHVFKDDLSNEEIKKWLGVFFKRFYQNQFKRSCLPEGAKIGTVSISPRTDLKMPSDADVKMILDEINEL